MAWNEVMGWTIIFVAIAAIAPTVPILWLLLRAPWEPWTKEDTKILLGIFLGN